MSTKELRPQIYYFIRRKWYDQLVRFCDNVLSKKGKEPTVLFWKAFGTGMSGNINDCLRQYEGLQSRRELQYAISLALLYFHRRALKIDYDAVDTLNSELSASEDVTKDLGFSLAARFCLYTGEDSLASKLCSRLLASTRGEPPSTPFELEAFSCECWNSFGRAYSSLLHGSTRDIRELIKRIEEQTKGKMEQAELDLLMLLVKCKLALKQNVEAINNLNTIAAMYPWFTAALADKAMILTSMSEWDQALDTAQRVLDVENDNMDALQIVAIHAFTQESQPHDAVQKLEDFDRCLAGKEPNSVVVPAFAASLFSNIVCRQPRALQICLRMLERAQSAQRRQPNPQEEALLLTEQASIYILQGPNEYPNAMRAFRDAAKKDPDSVLALLGMIRCPLLEGAYEDAEAQIELLTVMHNPEDLGAEFALLQAMLARMGPNKDMKKHLNLLNQCKEMFDNKALRSQSPTLWSPDELLEGYITRSPDFVMCLAVEYLYHIESSISVNIFSAVKGSRPSAESSYADEVNATGAEFSSMMSATGDASSVSGAEISPAVQQGMELLRKTISLCPGFVCSYIELARCYSTLGMHEEAVRVLHQCLTLQPNCTGALVATAKVELSRQNPTAADRALEQALSCDFTIRSVTLFRLARANVQYQLGQLDEAIAEMENIMKLPDMNQAPASSAEGPAAVAMDSLGPTGPQAGGSANANNSNSFADSFRLVDDDRVGAYATLAALYGKAKRSKEASKVLSDAKVVFAGTPQEVLVLVAASALAVEKNDFDSAVRMLDKIAEDSPTFVKAQLIKAEILLNHNRDQEGYTQCFHQLVERDPSAKNYTLLGEAYLKILNPEKAVEAFEAAHKMDFTNARLRVRIGRTLVATHEYHRAIDFYEQAIKQSLQESRGPSGPSGGGGGMGGGFKSSEAISLSHDLARLFSKLDRTESAIRVLTRALHDHCRDFTDLKQNVSTYQLLADVHLKKISASDAGNNDVLKALKSASELQKEVIMQIRSSSSIASAETLEAEKAILSNLCQRMGSYYVTYLNDPASAEENFVEALSCNLTNTGAMLGLAHLCRNRGDLEGCQLQCRKIISADETHEEATVLLSETIFLGAGRRNTSDPQQSGEDRAVEPLQQLLRRYPNNYRALERCITLLRRAGNLEDVPAYLAAAASADRRAGSHAGYRFCCGLYARFTNDISKAILEFNMARKDDTWGALALTHMIELYLNPDQEGAWEERDTGTVDENTSGHVAVAEALLKELRVKAGDTQRFKILENYCLLATRNEKKIAIAMNSFIEMLEADQDNLPAILGMATAHMVDKSQHKARNLLKRVAKMEMSTRDGEDFTKANLLLAKFYVDKSKFDMAQELCKKCLAHDRSCSQAWEILGLAMEKETNYENAAECYEKAWKLEFEASATVGFKLAFTYLKIKKYVSAIDVCETVLAMYPDYPRIKDEILKKAQLSIRAPNNAAN